jgi:hypothetical protein
MSSAAPSAAIRGLRIGTRRRMVIANTHRKVNREPPNKGMILPYLTAVVDGESVPIAVDPEQRNKRGVLLIERLARLGTPVEIPPGLKTVNWPIAPKAPR